MIGAHDILTTLALLVLGFISGVLASALSEIVRARLDKERWQVLRSRTFRQNLRLILS